MAPRKRIIDPAPDTFMLRVTCAHDGANRFVAFAKHAYAPTKMLAVKERGSEDTEHIHVWMTGVKCHKDTVGNRFVKAFPEYRFPRYAVSPWNLKLSYFMKEVSEANPIIDEWVVGITAAELADARAEHVTHVAKSPGVKHRTPGAPTLVAEVVERARATDAITPTRYTAYHSQFRVPSTLHLNAWKVAQAYDAIMREKSLPRNTQRGNDIQRAALAIIDNDFAEAQQAIAVNELVYSHVWPKNGDGTAPSRR